MDLTLPNARAWNEQTVLVPQTHSLGCEVSQNSKNGLEVACLPTADAKQRGFSSGRHRDRIGNPRRSKAAPEGTACWLLGTAAKGSVSMASMRGPVHASEPEGQARQHAREQQTCPEHPPPTLPGSYRIGLSTLQLDDPSQRIAEIRHDAVDHNTQNQNHRFNGILA
jgi:hypothetical protein